MERTSNFIITIAEKIIFFVARSQELRKIVIDILRELVKYTDNDLDDNFVDQFEVILYQMKKK